MASKKKSRSGGLLFDEMVKKEKAARIKLRKKREENTAKNLAISKKTPSNIFEAFDGGLALDKIQELKSTIKKEKAAKLKREKLMKARAKGSRGTR